MRSHLSDYDMEGKTVSLNSSGADWSDMAAAPAGGNAEGGDVTLTWQLGRRIGAGAFAEVFQAVNTETGELMAIKKVQLPSMDSDSDSVRALEGEIAVMRELRHPNIVRYLGTERIEGFLHIFLEFVSGGSVASLLQSIGAFEESLARSYTRQTLAGLEYLHSRGIVHCDIKGGNLLVTEDGVVKLADFNSSQRLSNIAGQNTDANELHTMAGTAAFMAPEVIRGTGHGKKADIWSVGCTVIEMVTASPPWHEMTNRAAVLFRAARRPPEIPSHLSAEPASFIRDCLQMRPESRPAVRDLLCHPWLTSGPAPRTPAARRSPSPSFRDHGSLFPADGPEPGRALML